MTARFTADPEIATSEAPFRAVRSDTTPACARLREQMRQFVPQCLSRLHAALCSRRRGLSETNFAANRRGPPQLRRRPFHCTRTSRADSSRAYSRATDCRALS